MIKPQWRILLLLSITATGGCGSEILLNKVSQPRAGRALNERVAIVYSRRYQINLAGLEKIHPYDIHKYSHIYLNLVRNEMIRPEEVFVSGEISREDVLLVHTEGYLEKLRNSKNVAAYLEAGAIKFLPGKMSNAGILRPFRYATGGTLLAARLALEHGVGINIGGGYHHAEPDRGGGFCIYADMPIAIRKLQAEKKIRRALVINLDAHQGNGTVACLEKDRNIFTFSAHEGGIYPHPKARSDLDIELSAGTNDETYLNMLKKTLPKLFRKSRPDIVFLQAGCDTLYSDPLANLAMTEDGIVTRDAMVIDECVRRKIPVVMVLGGGYSDNAWRTQYNSIARTIRTYGIVPGTKD